MKSRLFTKVSTRFISEKAVINAITKDGKTTLPAELNETLCQDLGCPSGTSISKITPVITKGVGSTQCKPYILHLNNGMQYFMKQTPGTNNSDIKQREADDKITRALGENNTHPFVKMTCATKSNEGNLVNGILFFPFVPGDNLFLTLQKNINNYENKKIIFTAIGDTLAIVHNNCSHNPGVRPNLAALLLTIIIETEKLLGGKVRSDPTRSHHSRSHLW